MSQPDIEAVRDHLQQFQSQLVARLEMLDGGGRFSNERIDTPNKGYTQPCVLEGGALLEKAAVHFTYSLGNALPAAATERNPDLAGKSFRATALSVIFHPWNPHIPTTHMNLRMFLVNAQPKVWYFGGGFDLTPYLPYVQDIKTWHEHARRACTSESQYETLKKQCDDYFFLPHRNETRGVGGLFFDDYVGQGFDESFEFVRNVGKNFALAYETILKRRCDHEWTEEQEEWMLIRRGRYAEFNLAIDRGTKYGLQSGRRVESVLASLPPRAKWRYQFKPPPSSPQSQLARYLQPGIEWLSIVDNSVDSECE